MKYYSQCKTYDLFDLRKSLSSLNKENRWVKLGDSLPWSEIEVAYNKRLSNTHYGAGNKPARMVVGALVIKHMEQLSDEKTIEMIQENPFMQYFVGLECFTEKPIFSPELFVSIRKRLDEKFFNALTKYLAIASGKTPKADHTDEEGHAHGGTLKVDATCCDSEMRYPTDSNLLEDGSRQIERVLQKLCGKLRKKMPKLRRAESRKAFLELVKKKRKSRHQIEKIKRIQLHCLEADLQTFMDFIGGLSTTVFSVLRKPDIKCIHSTVTMFQQQKEMFETGTRSCLDRIVSLFQPHIRPIVRGKAKANVEFGAKIGASIVEGYTYVDHLSWDAYNESRDLQLSIALYQERHGILPKEIQADKLYLNKENRILLKSLHIDCFNRPLGRPPKEENDRNLEAKKAAVGGRNEIEATFGTGKRVYGANNIRAKLADTADTWIGACFFSKNVMKFLRELLRHFLRKWLDFFKQALFMYRCGENCAVRPFLRLQMQIVI